MPRARKKPLSLPAQIDRIVKRIVQKFHPERIILFGSQARGDAGPDSDVDLLVVMPVEGSISEKRLEIRRALPELPVPVDVIITTPEDFAWRKDVVGTIEWPATHEGKVLYARTCPVLAVIREWLRKADNHLLAATHTLHLGADCPTESVCFHAQQCIENHLNALLVLRGTPFPKTHDIAVLRALLPPRLRPKLARKDQKRLTDYATVRRYPSPEPDILLSEARGAVVLAHRIRHEVRGHLPRAALRHSKT
jgi:predicted nucleotidyltransferase/HEPN domain-containing protein